QHPSARAHPRRVRPHDRDSDPNRSQRYSRRIPRRRAGALHTARGTGEAAHDKDHLMPIDGRATMATEHELQVQQKREVESKEEKTVPERLVSTTAGLVET